MTFSALMYGKTWRFSEQGLPFDLQSRCVASISAGSLFAPPSLISNQDLEWSRNLCSSKVATSIGLPP